MEKLLEVLSSVGIIIKARNGQLEILDPNKKLTPQLIDSIKSNKAELLILLEGFKNKKKEDKILLQEDKEYYSLSAAQKRLYFLYELDRSSTAYNVTQYFKLYGDLTLDKVDKVVAKLIDRHENLRTSFITINDEPKQRIQKKVNLKIDFIKQEKGQNTNDLLKSIRTSFYLQKAPLLKLALIEVAKGSYILMVDMHHIITDGVSSGIIVKDFVKFYNDENLPNVRVRYKDYSEWQNLKTTQEKIQKQKEWWLDTFKQEPTTLNLPIDFNRPKVMTSEGETINFNLTKEVSNELKKIASNESTTLFTVLIAIINILLSRICNTNDIVIGTPIAGRRNVDLEQTMGMFINTLPLRNFPNNNLNYLEFLSQVKSNVLKAFDNQDFQFEDLVNELKITRDTSRQPLFDVMFVLNNFNKKELMVPNLVVEPIESDYQNTKFDLTFNCHNSDHELQFSLEYYKPIFNRDTIERLILYFENIIHSIIKNRNIKISAIDILSEEEKHQLLYEFNKTETEYPKDKTIHQLFEEQVLKTPDNVAVSFNDISLTYSELNEKSNRLAWTLFDKGIHQGTVVGLHVEHSIEMIVGILGILKTGGCYLPIDKKYPNERKQFIIKESGTNLILVDEDEVLEFNNKNILNIKSNDLYSKNSINPTIYINSNSPVYIIYTSGSTGKPKGVVICHSNLVNYITWASKTYKKDNNLNFPLYSSISFDLTVTSVFTPLVNGAFVKIFHLNNQLSLIKEIIKDKDLGVMKLTPSHLQLLSEEDMRDCKIKSFIVGGEELSSSLAARINSGITIYNEYGPTESTVGCMIYKYESSKDKQQSVPIGRGAGNNEIYVLDNFQNFVPIGVSGELCVSGSGLALGYLNNQELTNSKFIDHPFKPGEKLYRTGDIARWLSNGNVEYLGRIDNQVKIRGFRVSLGEVEEVLSNYNHINDSVVIAKNDGSNNFLVAYYTSDLDHDIKMIKSYMLKRLPTYMVPNFIIKIESIPLTTNGKIDTEKLPDHSLKKNDDFEKPRNELEKRLVKIWEEVLDLKGYEIGVYDNFFDLGGNSISLLTLNNKIQKSFEVNLSIGDLMVSPTIREIATFFNSPKENTGEMIINAQKTIDVKNKTMSLLSKLKK
ncbi:MAG: amino acid adenylation domain-containing protein [Bacteroidales bacterium]|nr:amino acid adenylation domain-containing protein [Bacteroidales bacterium]